MANISLLWISQRVYSGTHLLLEFTKLIENSESVNNHSTLVRFNLPLTLEIHHIFDHIVRARKLETSSNHFWRPNESVKISQNEIPGLFTKRSPLRAKFVTMRQLMNCQCLARIFRISSIENQSSFGEMKLKETKHASYESDVLLQWIVVMHVRTKHQRKYPPKWGTLQFFRSSRTEWSPKP